MYTSHVAVIDFVEALGTWVEESILKRIQRASHYSIMADECTDTASLEEMSVFCRWEENGVPVEHFLEIIHLKKADAESIFSALVDCLKEKNPKLLGWGLMGQLHFLEKNRSPDSIQECCTSCIVCTLPLPLAPTGLCTSSKFNTRNEASVRHFDLFVEIFPLLTKKGTVIEGDPERP